MSTELKESFFTQHGRYLAAAEIKNRSILPFKDHPQFSTLVDILSRKNHHHALLCLDFPSGLHTVFFEALLQYLHHDHVPHRLRESELLCLNLDNALITEIKQLSIEKDFEALRDHLHTTDKYLIVALSKIDLFSKESKKADERFLRRQIESLLNHPKCRVLLITQPKDYSHYNHLDDQFVNLRIMGPTETDAMTILKQQKIDLELFHHIVIPEEVLSQSLLFAERYLSTSNTFEKASLLLDSSAARAGAAEQSDPSNPLRPVLTTSILLNVISDWTRIPVSHLQIHLFKHTEFTQNLLQHVFGQDTAVTILGHELIQAQTYLMQKNGPLSSFLFAGPAHSGKKTMAIALVEELFKQLNVLYFAQPSLSHHTVCDVKLQRYADKQFSTLIDVIQQTPYAVILFENIETLSTDIIDGLQEILSTGYLHDTQGNQYNFRQSIIILNTTIGSTSLSEFAESFAADEDIYTMDLMQLVMSDAKQASRRENHHYSAQEIIEKIMPDITDVLPLSLCQHLHLVPFLPLNKSAIEKIIRLKLKTLGKQLDIRYTIELGYAPEVIRYLTNEVLIKHELNKALKQLYFCIEQAILNQPDGLHSNQLFLQLNETGHLLRCDWLPLEAARHHAH